jgi:hypothetical protein
MDGIRSKLTFANVMSVIAVFIALGGIGVAAFRLPKNSVGARQLKPNAVNGGKVADNSLTGADVDASTLGLVPHASAAQDAASAANAAQLGGAPPSSYLKGSDPLSGDLTGTYAAPQIAAGAVTPDKIGAVPAVRVYGPLDMAGPACGSNQQLASGTATDLLWRLEAFDPLGMHVNDLQCQNPQRARLTAPRAGLYLVSAGVLWSQNPTGTRYLGINLNGTQGLAADERAANDAGGAGSTLQSVTTVTRMNQGEFVTAQASQASGSSLSPAPVPADTRAYFTAVWLGP